MRAGISIADIANIREEDIDFEAKSVRTGRGVIKVSQYCIELIVEAIGSPFYYDYDGKTIVLEDNGYIVRNLERPFSKVTEEQIRRRLRRAQDGLGLRL